MKRRDFIRLSANSLMGLGISAGLLSHACADRKKIAGETPLTDLVIAYGGNAPDRFSLAVKALGGLSRFSFEGKKILVKPAMKWNKPPGYGISTDPELVFRIIEDCYEQGSSGVYVLEHTLDNWRDCYKNSGIEEASKRAFGKIVPANEKQFYRFSNDLLSPSLHKTALDCDVIINVPSLVTNGTPCAGIANLEGLTWENGNPAYPLDTYRLQLLKACLPVLTLVDAGSFFRENKTPDAWFGKIPQNEMLVASADPVLAEAALCKLFGMDPASVPYLQKAEELGFGSTDVDRASLQVIELG